LNRSIGMLYHVFYKEQAQPPKNYFFAVQFLMDRFHEIRLLNGFCRVENIKETNLEGSDYIAKVWLFYWVVIYYVLLYQIWRLCNFFG